MKSICFFSFYGPTEMIENNVKIRMKLETQKGQSHCVPLDNKTLTNFFLAVLAKAPSASQEC